MVFTGSATEYLALILIVISAIKLITILIKPEAWLNNVVKKIYGPSKLMPWVFFILSLIVLYFLLQDLTIVQILAVTLFVSLIIGMGFSVYSQEFMELADRIYNEGNILKRSWLSTVFWVVLLLWGLREMFM